MSELFLHGLAELRATDVADGIGWMRLHSVWQFTAIALVFLMAGWLRRRALASARTMTQWSGMLMLLITPVGTSDNLPGELPHRATSDQAWLRFCPGTQIVDRTDDNFVSGVVVDEAGEPIVGCRVEHPGLVGPTTDEQGEFQYQQTVPHRTVLRVYHPDYRLWHGAPHLGDVLRIVLQKKQKVEVDDGPRQMTVRVIDSRTAEPVPHVKVTATRHEGAHHGRVATSAVTNKDGAAILRGLESIQHQLSLGAAQHVPYIGTRAYPNADELEVVMVVDRACELVLRAVDSETGKGIAGVRFDRERALAELWAAPVVSDILGSEQLADREILTDDDGIARFQVGPETWSYMILKYPDEYGSIVPISESQEVEIETPVGGKVEYTFRLVKL